MDEAEEIARKIIGHDDDLVSLAEKNSFVDVTNAYLQAKMEGGEPYEILEKVYDRITGNGNGQGKKDN